MLKPTLNTNWIDPRALEIIERLQKKGHTTYLVGGCVRDLLLGIHPKILTLSHQLTQDKFEELFLIAM